MKKISVELQKEIYLPGEVVRGQVHLTVDKPVSARAILLDVEGLEKTQITVSYGKHSHTYTEKNYIIQNRVTFHHNLDASSQELESGNYNFPFEFTVPEDAIPSYHGRNTNVTYMLIPRVDVPLWIDIKDKKLFYVGRNRDDISMYNRPVHFQSENYMNLDEGKPGFQVELPRNAFFAGQYFEGTITLSNMDACKVRGIKLRLVAIEHARAARYQRNQRLRKYESELPAEEIMEAMPVRFNIPVPQNVPGSFEGKYSNLRWALEVQLDLPLKFDVKASCPVEIFR